MKETIIFNSIRNSKKFQHFNLLLFVVFLLFGFSLICFLGGCSTGYDSQKASEPLAIDESVDKGKFVITVKFPKHNQDKKKSNKFIPENQKTLKVIITGESITIPIESTLDISGGSAPYTKTIENVPVGLNIATIQILGGPDPGTALLAQRKYGYFQFSGSHETSTLDMGVGIDSAGVCQPSNIDVPVGTTLYYQNFDYNNAREVKMSGGLTTGIISQAQEAINPGTPASFSGASVSFDTAGTYTYEAGFGAPGRVLVNGADSIPEVISVVDGDGDDSDPDDGSTQISFTITGLNFGTSQAEVSGVVKFYKVDAPTSTYSPDSITNWSDTQITGTITIPKGIYCIAVNARTIESTDVVYYFKGHHWMYVSSNKRGSSLSRADYTCIKMRNGMPFLAYKDLDNGNKATCVRFNNRSWDTVGTAGFSAGEADYVTLDLLGNIPYVAYKDGANAGKATCMKYNGTSWENVGNAGFSEGTADYVSMFMYNDIPYIIYKDGNDDGRITAKKFDGSSWKYVSGGDIKLRNKADYISLYCHNGIQYLAFKDLDNSRKLTVKKYNSAAPNWETIGTQGFSDGEVDYVRLSGSNDTLYVVYKDDSQGGKATCKKYNGTSWQTLGSDGFSAGTADYISLYVYNDSPYVAYKDGSDSNKITVMKYNGSVWESVGGTSVSDSFGSYSSIYVYNGTPYVAYVEGSCVKLKKYDGSNWVSVGSTILNTTYGKYNLSLYVYDGTPYVCYDYRSPYNSYSYIYVKKFNGSSWVQLGSTYLKGEYSANCVSFSMYNGTPYIAYRDYNKSDRITVKKYSGTGWEVFGSEGFSREQALYISLCFSDDGTPYVAYKNATSTTAAVAVYNGSQWGNSWSLLGESNVSDNLGSYCSIYVYNGTPYVVYVEGSCIRVRKYDGSNWVSVSDNVLNTTSGKYNVSIYVYNGTPYVCYDYRSSYNSYSYIYVKKFDGSSWVQIDSNYLKGEYSANCVTFSMYNGTPYVAYRDYDKSDRITVKKHNGTSWEVFGTDGFSREQAFYLSLCFSDDGTPYVAYKNASSATAAVAVYNGCQWGKSWSFLGESSVSDSVSSYCSIYVYNGTPYVSYVEGSYIKVKKYDGNNWVSVGDTVLGTTYAKYNTCIYVYNGTPYVACYYKFSSNSYSFVYTKKFNGSTWITVGNSNVGEGEYAAHCIALSVYDGYPYVAYRDSDRSDRITVKKGNVDNWEVIGSTGFSTGTVLYPSLDFDSTGTAYIAYKDGSLGNKACCKKYNGSAWEDVGTSGLISDGVADYISLCIHNDIPYVAYKDGNSTNKATLKKFNSATNSWDLVGTAGFSAGSADYISLRFYNDIPYVTYKDGANGDKATAMKYSDSTWSNVGNAGFTEGTADYVSSFIYDSYLYVVFKDAYKDNFISVKKY